MNKEGLIKLNRDEMNEISICLSLRRETFENMKREEDSDIESVNAMIKFVNDEADKKIAEIDAINEKMTMVPVRHEYSNLEELSKADLILKIKQLEDKNYELIEENEDLKYDLEAIKKSDNMTTIQVADYFTTYENIQRRYDANDVPYQMESEDDITKVFGLRFNSIEGFYDLSEEDKEIFKKGIVKFLNGFGLGNRVPYLPTKVWKMSGEFRFLTLEGGEREQYMNSIGEVY